MKKFIILIPVYNDWESLTKLLNEINSAINEISGLEFRCIIVDDASTIKSPIIIKPHNISSVKVIQMKENRGHARCNAFGIRYIDTNEEFDHLILMDGDGEDRPEELKKLITKCLSDTKISVVAKRIKRSEGIFFRILYEVHKIITFIFTGKIINFGNYSCLTKRDINILSSKGALWSSFSGSLKKHINNLNEIDSIRGLRYFGPSKMSLYRLGIHSFAIMAVFKNIIFFRSALFIVILSFLNTFAELTISLIQIILVVFNLLIFIVSQRENEKELKNSHLNVKKTSTITH